MKRKAIISLILVAVLAFGAGMGTIAYFTSQAASTGNTFATGELTIGLTGTGTTDICFNITGVAPGDAPIPQTITVNNDGDFAFKYKVSATRVTATGDAETKSLALYNALRVSVYSGSNTTAITGLDDITLSSLTDKLVNSNLAADADETLTFKVYLPATAGNDCQGAATNVTLTFDATQTTNSGWSQSGT